jgi:hypothetical protein
MKSSSIWTKSRLHKTMPHARSRIAVGLVAVVIVGATASLAQAQQGQPNLRMLLNLDLFAANPSSSPGENGGGDPGNNGSMLEQIQTLQALGLLRGKGGGGAEPPGPPPEPGDSPDQFTPGADRP